MKNTLILQFLLFCSFSLFISSTNATASGVGKNGALTSQVISKSFEQGYTEPTTGMEFVWVPGGCYKMGCGSWQMVCEDDEKPVHEACVDGFHIGKYEVTQGQWEKIMGSNPSNFQNGENYPVEKVSWNDTQEYIKKLEDLSGKKFRLPTEAEWEYACRSGGKKDKYCGGNDYNSVAWYGNGWKIDYKGGNSGDQTHPVGTKKENELGIYDMSGNVYEWCHDEDGEYNNPQSLFGSLFDFDSHRVARGGSWATRPIRARSTNRHIGKPSDHSASYLGFRLVLLTGS